MPNRLNPPGLGALSEQEQQTRKTYRPMCVHAHIHACMHACMHAFHTHNNCVRPDIQHVYIYVYVSIIYIYMYVCMCVYIYACLIFIYIYICTHICIGALLFTSPRLHKHKHMASHTHKRTHFPNSKPLCLNV